MLVSSSRGWLKRVLLSLMKTAIVTAATDVFALPATVINLFLVEHLESMKGGDIFVLDCGLVPQSWRKMGSSDKFLSGVVKVVKFEDEEGLIAVSVCRTSHDLDLIVDAFHAA